MTSGNPSNLQLNAHFAIGNYIQDALSAEQITVAGDGTPLRMYLDQSDIAHWLWTLMIEGLDGESLQRGVRSRDQYPELADLVRDVLAPSKLDRILVSFPPMVMVMNPKTCSTRALIDDLT